MTIYYRTLEISADEFDPLHGVGIDNRMCAFGRIGLDAMGQRIDARRRRDGRRNAFGQPRIDDRDIGQHFAAFGRDLAAILVIGDQGTRPDFRAGSRSRRYLDETDHSLRCAVGPRYVGQRQIAVDHHRDELGKVHRRAATEADDEIGTFRNIERSFEHLDVGFTSNIAKTAHCAETKHGRAGAH